MEIGLSLGSNLDDRLNNIRLATDKISSLKGVTLLAGSPVYETEPVGDQNITAHPDFLNSALIINSDINRLELLKMFREIEVEMGRPAGHAANTPRVIDIDIIYAGDTVLKTPTLTIPHPRWATRRFVVQPLADLRPDIVIPGSTQTVRGILLTLPEKPKVLPYIP